MEFPRISTSSLSPDWNKIPEFSFFNKASEYFKAPKNTNP